MATSASDHAVVNRIVDHLSTELDRLCPALAWGVCHGDLTLDNFTITESERITFIDFDLASTSWRARDLSGVYAFSRLDPEAGNFWEAFLGGYRTVRPFGVTDERSVPLMHAVNQLWDLTRAEPVERMERGVESLSRGDPPASRGNSALDRNRAGLNRNPIARPVCAGDATYRGRPGVPWHLARRFGFTAPALHRSAPASGHWWRWRRLR